MQTIKDIISLIDSSIKIDANNLLMGGNIIKDGYNPEVDEYRDLINNSNEWLNDYTKNLIKETGISTLKVKFTSASGYFIEVPLSQKSKIPENFILKTTLVNAVRFTTQELQRFESKVVNAESLLYEKEYILFKEISNEILSSFKEIKEVSKNISNIDFISNLSHIAYENNYIKPEITNDFEINIKDGRHPVIEKIEKKFISNDLNLQEKKFINIITGPNMGGKSTYLRQNALIILMGHIGSFVPAIFAKISLTDKIFSRVGASDNLFLGNSTFMVEMQEVANILNNSTKNSFVIIDEVGRGTSTYDGMSLAWAILRENHDKTKAKTLFATHYHELVDESKRLLGVSNYSVAVSEENDNIIFLRKIVPGSIKKSYGIEVARLAGLPVGVIDEANNFLKKFEQTHDFNQMSLGFGSPHPTTLLCSNFEESRASTSVSVIPKGEGIIKEKIVYKEKESEVENELKNIDLNSLTPLDALNILSELKGKI